MGIHGRMTGLVGGHAKSFGVTSYMPDECRDMHPKEMTSKVIEIVGDGPTYIFDLDALDAIYISASSAAEPFGLDANRCWDVIRHIRASEKVNLVGADVVEYAPQNDPAKTFVYVAAALSWKILCWMAADMAKRNGEDHPTVWEQAFGSVTLG